MPDSNEDGALHTGESSSTRESEPIVELNRAEVEAVVSMGIDRMANRWGKK